MDSNGNSRIAKKLKQGKIDYNMYIYIYIYISNRIYESILGKTCVALVSR